jgi:CxxC motif-containing protein (DUF1111 family)
MRGRVVLAVLLAAGVPLAAAARGDLSSAIGKALFERAWVPAPSSTKANDGLGPLFNARACSACHEGLGRASSEVDAGGRFTDQGMVVKLSDADGSPDAAYGAQVQTAAVPGFVPEARISKAADGLRVEELSSGPFEDGTRAGLRAAPALRGLGRLADVPDEVILAAADPDDRDGDGISGRANLIEVEGRMRPGRFGLKASSVTLQHQVELAFAMDLGMSTQGFPEDWGDCPSSSCREAPHGGEAGEPEIRADLVAMLTGFLESVRPPPSRASDEEGARLFAAAGCAACHTPALPSPRGEVRAYTDLLLHDLGPGLDGGATEPGVASTEWRTAPLWGLSAALAERTGLLHDGRAKGVADAVALHGGEAAAARDRMQKLPDADRERLISFVEGL